MLEEKRDKRNAIIIQHGKKINANFMYYVDRSPHTGTHLGEDGALADGHDVVEVVKVAAELLRVVVAIELLEIHAAKRFHSFFEFQAKI